jgi:Rrf2 family transcriptional regulator, nitric oxide-sensitive transcriptional repressor
MHLQIQQGPRVRPIMKLSTFTDYSLRMLMYLAAEPQRRATIAEIATAFGISEHHLGKVAHGLGRDGWLANVRGHGGGLALAMAPQQIGIGQVVRLTERADLPATCFADDSEPCAIGAVCRLRGMLDEALQAFYGVLDRYTLADLARNPRALSRLLFVDKTPAPPLGRRMERAP